MARRNHASDEKRMSLFDILCQHSSGKHKMRDILYYVAVILIYIIAVAVILSLIAGFLYMVFGMG